MDVGSILDRVVNAVDSVLDVIVVVIDLRTTATSCSSLVLHLGKDFWHWVGLFGERGFYHTFFVIW